jgi:hypothetical protein
MFKTINCLLINYEVEQTWEPEFNPLTMKNKLSRKEIFSDDRPNIYFPSLTGSCIYVKKYF